MKGKSEYLWMHTILIFSQIRKADNIENEFNIFRERC